MDDLVSGLTTSQFSRPKDHFGQVDAALAARIIAASSDIALIIDTDGTIKDAAVADSEVLKNGAKAWPGQKWADIVTIESRGKVEAIRKEAGIQTVSRWREINHPMPDGHDLPVRYSAMRLGKQGPLLAFGRDIRGLASLQQQLVNAQLSMEREFARLRHAETRYRMLFQITAEAVLIVDASNNKVLEANPAAGRLLDVDARKIAGRQIVDLLPRAASDTLRRATTRVLAGASGEDELIALGDGRKMRVSVSLFRQERSSYLLVRLQQAGIAEDPKASERSVVIDALEKMPEGFVVADSAWRIVSANQAFLDLVHVASQAKLTGQPLDMYFARPGVDLNVLMSNLREHGAVQRFATMLRDAHDQSWPVEIAAVSTGSGKTAHFGFSIRQVVASAQPVSAAEGLVPQTPEQLTSLIGHMPLKDIVREMTSVIERMCIESALQLTGDNRASASQMLGLSRQSLYAKLRRYGFDTNRFDSDDL